MEEFGRRLRYYRKRRRLTQSQLAGQVGVAAAYVSQIESALRMPSLKVARKFAASLGVELPTLLGNEDASASTDQLSDSEKLEVLRRLVRSIEFDQDHRPLRLDMEDYGGCSGVVVSQSAEEAVRTYTFPGGGGDELITFHFHPGDEVVYCAAGTIHLMVNGSRHTLRVGEMLRFDSTNPHSLWGEAGSVAVSTVHPPLSADSYEAASAEATNGVSTYGKAEVSEQRIARGVEGRFG